MTGMSLVIPAIANHLTTAVRNRENADPQTPQNGFREWSPGVESFVCEVFFEKSLHPFSISSVTSDERCGCRGVNTLKWGDWI
jgi:hypothetical protein